MLRLRSFTTILALLLIAIAGCSSEEQPPTPSPKARETAKPQSFPTKPLTSSPQKDTYEDAVIAAEGANTIAESAQSRDDWNLAAEKWQEAITLMKAVPKSSRNYPDAQKKLTTYQAKLATAKQKASPEKLPAGKKSSPTVTSNKSQPLPEQPTSTGR